MGSHLDRVPSSGIIRIRDMMFTVKDPFRLDQGDVSFDAPDTVKQAMIRALAENRTHYVQTAGIPALRERLADKLRRINGVPVRGPEDVLVSNGGIHAIYAVCHALLEPGDEVVIPDPLWPPAISIILSAHGVPVGCPLHESMGWRWDLDELRSTITPRTRALYVNSPNNPTGGLLTRDDLEGFARLAAERGLWIISDEAYEDVIYEGPAHVSCASFDGLYERTIPVYTFSKTYAMTGLRLGYLATCDSTLRDRILKVLTFTSSNVSSVVQYGGVGALEGTQAFVDEFREELRARRDLFFGAVGEASNGVLSGTPPAGAFYAFLRIRPDWQPRPDVHPQGVPSSRSWAFVEELIRLARVGCVPGADFGPHGEDHVRFCFARERAELLGALESMRQLFH
jgi:aspartate aminotransferase